MTTGAAALAASGTEAGYGNAVETPWRRPAPAALLDGAAAIRLGAGGLLALAARERERADSRGFRITTILDDDYPVLLREIPDPPPVLYIWGSLEPDDEVRVGVVGSRRASRYGLEVAKQLALRLARRGVVVVSGLARGVDAAAHRGALSAPARTLAVLGSGLERIYPRENLDLAREAAVRGAVLSEYPLDLGPFPQLFPRRNRVISGLSAGVVVVEAAMGSGALGTARLALEQGREVYSVPGSVLSLTSVGTNALLCEGGAHMVTRAEDVMRELPPAFRMRLGLSPSAHAEPPAPPPSPGAVPLLDEDQGAACAISNGSEAHPTLSGREKASVGLPDDPDARLVWKNLDFENGASIDELTRLCSLPISRLLAAISALELRGLVESLPGDRVGRTRPGPGVRLHRIV